MSNFPIDTMRHSLAHLMAQAITREFPDHHIEFGVGPVIDNGFYYDVDIDHRFEQSDLKKIEARMKKLIKEKLSIDKKVFNSKKEAIDFFKQKNQSLKVELINDLDDSCEISTYSQGEFVDLCSGPHVENTSDLPMSFKLLNTAGAYWRGDENNKMLQRIYACAFATKDELKAHLFRLEQAKKRDHRKLGKELELFHFNPLSPGSPFFEPKGAFIYNQLIEYMRRIYSYYGYSEVITPQVLDSSLWKTSGHYDHYKENMYFTDVDEREFGIKPMNCPSHMLMYSNRRYSYRDLPLRFADFGRLHRYEKSGSLGGLTRVRTFCQDDGHIFISIDAIQNEIVQLMEMFFTTYKHFGFNEIKVKLSTRPEKRVGDDSSWDLAEDALAKALSKSHISYELNEGDGAFYGPKIDVQISDAIGRYFQLGTIQLDFQLPEKFDLSFTNQKGEKERPVVIHRALLGSIERFLGIYIEHTAGVFPFWIAPTQATLIPVNNDSHLNYTKEIADALSKQGFRVEIDDRNETLGFKTRQTQKSKIPFMIVIGDKEIENSCVNLRAYGSRESVTIEYKELLEKFTLLNNEKTPLQIRE